MAETDRDVVLELRRLRRDRRLGSTEWFDIAYRVYLFTLGGAILVVWASDSVDGAVAGVGRTDLLSVGPGVAGIAVAVAIAVGLRHGAEGGPIALEPGDVRHLLSSPIDRRTIMLRPIVQRMRSISFLFVVVLAIMGQLVARDVVGSRAAWAGAGALFGVLLGVVYVAAAVLAHAFRLPRWAASLAGATFLAWQLVTAVATWRVHDRDETVSGAVSLGPFDLAGSLALWGVRQRWLDVIALALVALGGLAAAAAGRGMRIEPLERRGQLVSQLRFAATMQDIRTVVQLRRQLSAEAPRPQPWFGSAPQRPARPTVPRSRPVASTDGASSGVAIGLVVRRGVASFGRFPLSRIVRVALLAACAGLAVHAALDWTPLAYVGLVLALFLVGLELLEPLSQEIDRPDRTDGLPVDRSTLFAAHLLAPALAAVPVAVIGVGVVAALDTSRLGAAVVLALPVAWAGMIGAAVTTIGDATRPPSVAHTTVFGADRLGDNPFALPEFAGVSGVVSGVVPLLLSAAAVVPVVAADVGGTAGAAVRGVIAVALCLAVLVLWIKRRDRWAAGIRRFFAEGRAAAGSTT